jgi:hypothetical protein
LGGLWAHDLEVSCSTTFVYWNIGLRYAFWKFRAPEQLWWRRVSSSRSGCTQTHSEIDDYDTFVVTCVFVYISNIDFHVLTLPRSSRARHDVRLEKSVPTAPISSSFITSWCRSYMVRWIFLDKRQFLPPGISWNKHKETDRFAYNFLKKRFHKRLPFCTTSSNTSAIADRIY